MSASRTQIYLTPEQRERIDRVAHSKGMTMSEVIRTAVDQYLGETPDPAIALASTFGADAGVTVPSRDEWGHG